MQKNALTNHQKSREIGLASALKTFVLSALHRTYAPQNPNNHTTTLTSLPPPTENHAPLGVEDRDRTGYLLNHNQAL